MPTVMAYQQKGVQPFLPEEPGLRAHVLRVSGLAVRAARSRGMRENLIEAIEAAAALHHFPVDATQMSAATQILRDLGAPLDTTKGPLPDDAATILRALGRAEEENSETRAAAALIESANLFDEQMEGLPYETASTDEAVAELRASGLLDRGFVRALDEFRAISKHDLLETSRRLPVFPKAAMDALRMARDPHAGVREMERAIGRDPVLSAEVVQLANSGLFGTWNPVNSISAALSRVGTIAAGKLIAAAAVRRCFVSGNLHQLWSHSFEAAEDVALTASEAQQMDVAEAYLGGLVHDLGRLAFELSPAIVELRQWIEAGFPLTYAEFLISGTDHAAIGAEVLRTWRFPESIIEGVCHHHRPERTKSKLAAAIFACERLDEDLPSCARDHYVSRRLEIERIRPQQAAG